MHQNAFLILLIGLSRSVTTFFLVKYKTVFYLIVKLKKWQIRGDGIVGSLQIKKTNNVYGNSL